MVTRRTEETDGQSRRFGGGLVTLPSTNPFFYDARAIPPKVYHWHHTVWSAAGIQPDLPITESQIIYMALPLPIFDREDITTYYLTRRNSRG